jgi:hypothetical protein
MSTIILGAEGLKYTVHRDFLTYYSLFFRKALEGSFKEKEGSVKLPDEEPLVADRLIFESFVYWL